MTFMQIVATVLTIICAGVALDNFIKAYAYFELEDDLADKNMVPSQVQRTVFKYALWTAISSALASGIWLYTLYIMMGLL